METKEFSKIVFRCKWIYVSENLRNRFFCLPQEILWLKLWKINSKIICLVGSTVGCESFSEKEFEVVQIYPIVLASSVIQLYMCIPFSVSFHL